ncbi:MAG: HAD-IC family P-type ATPase, partial [Lachnospiraceae bacterium]|nr:HAD-IC family P-type ATPase [Lachnospiraceae bacterium]
DFAAAQDADNITMRALKAYFTAPSGRKAVSVSGFSSQFKYSGVCFEGANYVLGAPEFLLKASYETYRERIEARSREGLRVLAFGTTEAVPDGRELTAPVRLLGLVFLDNAIRESAPSTFRFFAEQGVAIKVISGDNPVTVSRIAARAGIPDAESYVDASALKTEAEAKAAILAHTVFGRVSPEQKKIFVSALKEAGHTVAMTGDGVNDILAMKESDCSVAMAAGSDAAVQASQLVLLESDFAKMPAVVDEGRRVVNNLERSGSFYLVKNVFSFLIALSAICIGFTYPLLPLQITLIGAFTIGVPSFFLAQAPNKDLIRGNFLKNVFRKALPGGIADAVTVIPLVLIASGMDLPLKEVRTAATVTVAAIGMLIHYGIARPLDRYKTVVFVLCGVGLVLTMLVLHDLLELVPLSLPAALLAAGAFAVAVPVYLLLRRLLEK